MDFNTRVGHFSFNFLGRNHLHHQLEIGGQWSYIEEKDQTIALESVYHEVIETGNLFLCFTIENLKPFLHFFYFSVMSFRKKLLIIQKKMAYWWVCVPIWPSGRWKSNRGWVHWRWRWNSTGTPWMVHRWWERELSRPTSGPLRLLRQPVPLSTRSQIQRGSAGQNNLKG